MRTSLGEKDFFGKTQKGGGRRRGSEVKIFGHRKYRKK